MKQGKIITAYKVLNRLTEIALPLPVSYKLFKLKKALSPAWEFQIQEENRILEKYQPESEGNSFKLKNEKEAGEFRAAFKELAEMESDCEFKPISLPVLPDLTLSGSDIEALDGFVVFPDLDMEEKSDGEI